jgi:hypothetical protein
LPNFLVRILPTQRREEPKLLSGGIPQIPKGDGDSPVQAYIDEKQLAAWIKQAATLPGWIP